MNARAHEKTYQKTNEIFGRMAKWTPRLFSSFRDLPRERCSKSPSASQRSPPGECEEFTFCKSVSEPVRQLAVKGNRESENGVNSTGFH